MNDRVVPVRAVGPIAADVVERAESALARQHTLADVLAWGRAQSPPRGVAEIVTQDEYTHDVVMSFDGSHFLAFDAT